MRVKASTTCPISVCALFMNLRRTGVLKNKWRISMVVPIGPEVG